jgi:hypothetical protein
MGQVIIGMDPHKRSATIEVMAADETVLGGGAIAPGCRRSLFLLAVGFRLLGWRSVRRAGR